ncbi:hypothetical protein SAMN04488557_0531 [Hyphomicrobium facile]|uniref:DUF2946 domain-containing protein n=1 Tax=Hyphomicrobium facile TaxID=51670 RepID=A0A1I7MW14_9HYPH|nr:hypothetical protein SAMN04488557_0531 [Hyphomicrobium facile]
MTASRLRIRLVLLTLFAFGVQLAVASFHHHTSREISARSIAAFAGHCVSTATKPCAPASDDHDNCPLCWAAAMAATSLVPSLFDFPAPSEIVFAQLQTPLSTQSCIIRCYEQRARGPPAANVV